MWTLLQILISSFFGFFKDFKNHLVYKIYKNFIKVKAFILFLWGILSGDFFTLILQLSQDLDNYLGNPQTIIQALAKAQEKIEDVKTQEELSFFQKTKNFLYENRWYIFGVLVVSVAAVTVFLITKEPPPPSSSTPTPPTASSKPAFPFNELHASLNNPVLPSSKLFIEDQQIITFDPASADRLADHFQVTKVFYADAQNLHITGIAVLYEDTSFLPFRVYSVKPTLISADVGIEANNPYGYAEEPSLPFWVAQAQKTYPVLQNLEPLDFTLQYQKVALADPETLKYAYFHQISVVPTNIEALSEPFERDLSEKALRIFLFKDVETGWKQ